MDKQVSEVLLYFYTTCSECNDNTSSQTSYFLILLLTHHGFLVQGPKSAVFATTLNKIEGLLF